MKKWFTIALFSFCLFNYTWASAAGYWASNAKFVVNGINSPILRSAVVSPIAAGAGHIAGGTTANLFGGQSLNEAFLNSFKGIGQSMLINGAIGVGTTIAVSYASGINPLNGKPLSVKQQNVLDKNGIYGTQKEINTEIRDIYYEQMMKGEFDLNSQIGGFKSDGNYYVGDGHHRMSAALKYYYQTGDSSYINHLINTGRWTPANPKNYGLTIFNIR